MRVARDKLALSTSCTKAIAKPPLARRRGATGYKAATPPKPLSKGMQSALKAVRARRNIHPVVLHRNSGGGGGGDDRGGAGRGKPRVGGVKGENSFTLARAYAVKRARGSARRR